MVLIVDRVTEPTADEIVELFANWKTLKDNIRLLMVQGLCVIVLTACPT
jgi:hypothetical protein